MVLESPDQRRQAILQSRPVILDRLRHRLQFRLSTLTLAEFGSYALLLEFKQNAKWETAARLPILIRPTE